MAAQNDIEVFFNKQTLYDKILEYNYMCHQNLFGAVFDILATKKNIQSFLDIGCGNAKYALDVVKDIVDISYCGIDVASDSVAQAQARFNAHNINAEFMCQDMLDAVNTLLASGKKFDVILSSFAIHHYSNQDKQELFYAICRLLNDDGIFIFIDLFRQENTDRDYFLNTTMQKFYTSMPKLSLDEIKEVQNHVESSDFPQTIKEAQDSLCLSGFCAVKSHLEIEHYAVIVGAKLPSKQQ